KLSPRGRTGAAAVQGPLGGRHLGAIKRKVGTTIVLTGRFSANGSDTVRLVLCASSGVSVPSAWDSPARAGTGQAHALPLFSGTRNGSDTDERTQLWNAQRPAA